MPQCREQSHLPEISFGDLNPVLAALIAFEAALFAQENPPTAQWQEMPRYELIGRPSE